MKNSVKPLTTGNAGCWQPEKHTRQVMCQRLQSPLGSTSPGKLMLFSLKLRQGSKFSKLKMKAVHTFAVQSDQENQTVENFLSHWFLEGPNVMCCQWVWFHSYENTSPYTLLTSFRRAERWILMSLFILYKQSENLTYRWYSYSYMNWFIH